MEIQSVNSRALIVSELGIVLHFHTVEVPPEVRRALENKDDTGAAEQQLVEASQRIFGLGPTEVVPFSRWRYTGQQVLKYLDTIREIPGTDVDAARTNIRGKLTQFKSPDEIVSAYIKNALLVPARQRSMDYDTASVFNRLTVDQKWSTALYRDLLTYGVSEAEFGSWRILSDLLEEPSFHITAEVAKEIRDYELPVAASPGIKAITIQTFQKLCNGAAALMITETAFGASSPLLQGHTPAIATVITGAATALVFVSVGSLAGHLEAYLKSLVKAPQSHSPTKSHRAQARAA